ncbi:unnamed protein product [Meloidogyne enterolobii]|uniref:Uncharacterized protein n=1 Tax=Meloidogyne enterolobii TaxID=390850 RepID=A0ACB1AGY7_MELEN
MKAMTAFIFQREKPSKSHHYTKSASPSTTGIILNKQQQQHKCHQKEKKTTQKTSLISKQMQQIHPSPLSKNIRRARIIRRKTTTVYCDTLKRLKDEDAVLINQILIIRLRPRSEATEFECSCVNNSNIDSIPSVDFAYPPMGSNASNFPPQLFYPDFMKGTVQRREERETYQVVLTNDKAERTFAFCFKFPTLPQHSSIISTDSGISTLDNRIFTGLSVLVLISPYPNEGYFSELAADLVLAFQRDNARLLSMCRDLLQLRLTTSESFDAKAKYIVRDEYGRQQWTRSHMSTILKKIGMENALFIFLNMLAERRIIITGSNVTDVSQAVHALVRLLAPLEWPHGLIPILPDSQIEYCQNPTPYIYGLLRYNLSRISELIVPQNDSSFSPDDNTLNDDIILFDVEMGIIVPPISRPKNKQKIGLKALLEQTELIGFPRAAVCELLGALKSCIPIKDAEKADYRIEKKIMIFYAKLFGHYRSFGQDILTARNRKLFARAHPCSETRLFLNWFIENGILQYFISIQEVCFFYKKIFCEEF